MSDRPIQRPRKQAQVRLADRELAVVIAGYEAGLDLNELSSAFGADRRGRRLTEEQIQEAIQLYNGGWSLARIATRLGVYPQSIRYRLPRADVVLRPRPGRSHHPT